MEWRRLLPKELPGLDRRLKLHEIAIGITVGAIAVKLYLGYSRRRSLLVRAQAKRKQNLDHCKLLLDRLQKDKDLVDKKDYITGLCLEDLIDALQTGRLKAVEAVRAYQLKALEVNQDLNCVVEPILEAEEQALALDHAGVVKGPLHGVPISLKDEFCVQGYDSHIGLTKRTFCPRDDDAVIVKVLRQQGAIPIVKTTVPTIMFSFECSNQIDGVTQNPHAQGRSPGGSSGGEGALIGARGSILGMGTDIGGSIRIPGHFNGVCGLKPCSHRLSDAGSIEGLGEGQTCVLPSLGPMGRDVDTLAKAMEALLIPAMNELDRYHAHVPFDKKVYNSTKPLRIGYFMTDGDYNPLPPCQRAVSETKQLLESQGHTLIPFTWGADRIREGSKDLYTRAMFGDTGAEFKGLLKDEPYEEALGALVNLLRYPPVIRHILCYLCQPFMSKNTIRNAWNSCCCRNTVDYQALQTRINHFKRECLSLWEGAGLDALICPVSTVVAYPHGASNELLAGESAGFHLTILYNMLDWPAGVLPVTTVNDVDIKLTEYYPTPGAPERCSKEMMSGAEGLPVGVQVVTLPWQEELCLRVMKDIERGRKGN